MVNWKIGLFGFSSVLPTSRPDTYEVRGMNDLVLEMGVKGWQNARFSEKKRLVSTN